MRCISEMPPPKSNREIMLMICLLYLFRVVTCASSIASMLATVEDMVPTTTPTAPLPEDSTVGKSARGNNAVWGTVINTLCYQPRRNLMSREQIVGWNPVCF